LPPCAGQGKKAGAAEAAQAVLCVRPASILFFRIKKTVVKNRRTLKNCVVKSKTPAGGGLNRRPRELYFIIKKRAGGFCRLADALSEP
jgi:hypothetical protein